MLELQEVTIRFHNQPPVAREVSFSVPQNKTTVVIGESGSGKSVLLLAILRLLPARVSVTGNILFNGRDILCCTEREMNKIRRTEVAYIPQGSGNGLNPLYTVGRQLTESLIWYGAADKQNAAKEAVSTLKHFGFADSETVYAQYPHMLSGGMRQRVLVAMGAAGGAGLLLADEPTKGLDQGRIDLVAETFESLNKQTILCVTHDLRFARRIADRVVVMYASQKVEENDSEEFFVRPMHPYSQAMLNALPENGLHAAVGFAPPRQGNAETEGCIFADRCPDRHDRCQWAPPAIQAGGGSVRCWKFKQ